MSKLLSILFFLSVTNVFCLHSVMKGQVIDSNKVPIAYASVAVMGTSYGTVSNQEGGFELVIKENDYNGKVAISFVGYETISFPVDTSKHHTVVLKEKGLELPSAFVLGFEAKELIEKFELHRPINYPTFPAIYKMFLREQEKIHFGADIYISELLVDYLRYDCVSSRKDKIRIEKGRNFHFLNLDSLGYTHPEGGLFDIQHDLVKYPNDIVKSGGTKKYVYELEGAYEESDRLVYKLKFSPATKKSRYTGYLYIEDESFALVKAEIGYDEEGMNWLNHDSWSSNTTWESMKKTITYKKHNDGKYRLAEIVIEGRGNNHVLKKDIISQTELITVELSKTDGEEKTFGPIDRYAAISDLNFKATPNFWKDNNYIKPEDHILANQTTSLVMDSADGF